MHANHVDPLPDDAVVVRGGIMEPKSLSASAMTSYADDGAYSLSVFAFPGLDADDTARAAREVSEDHLPQRRMRVSTVARIRQAGYDLAPTPPDGHYSLMLPDPPTEADWELLDSIFDPPRPNPVAR